MKVKNRKNPVIMTLIVVVGLLIVILIGLSIKSEATKKKLEKFYNETMSDSEIDANLIAGQEVMSDNPGEAEKIFKEIEDYRPEAKYYLGMYDYSRGNKDAALEKFLKSANTGLKEGMFYAGVIYDERKDYKEAEKWYLKAEKEGLAEATIRLANLYNIQKNQKKRKEKLLALSKREEVPFMYELGVLYIKEKKYDEAKNLFLKLKEYNMIKAEDRLADIDEILKNQNNEKIIDEKLSKLGDNISKEDTELIFKEAQKMIYGDSDKVVTYLEKIEKYHPKAAIYLAEYYIYTNNNKKRDEWLLKAAEKGDASAMNGMANIYEADYKDFAEAEKWYKKAAEKNYSIGMTRLGELYHTRGNIEEAKKWFKKSVQKGERSALNDLAVVYLIERNYKEAENLFLRSVKENNFVSMRNFSELYRVQEKYEEAEKLDKKLFEIGDFDRAVEIGNAESEKRNYAEAEKWYLAGAEKGNIVSMYSLAYFYENVNDYNYKDVDKAIEWCEKASNEGYPLAMLRLGHLYYQKGNRRKAKFWFEKALINGRLDAKKGLEKLN